MVKRYSGKFDAYQRTYVLFNFKQVTRDYLFYYLKSKFNEHVKKNLKTASVPYMTIECLEEFPIPIPPIEIQNNIVEILDKFDSLINNITEGLPKEIKLREKQYEYYLNLIFKKLSK